ncbi:ABC transporter permease [Streptomyces sp. TLI_171]|uniref:ABC transporter permease n=1 Tax=Streptomyces sp. TLI_171 TaxID=1938859 RepID=UPI000C184FBE|nr:FtsX-like permease family protein [Streptomyces sp. TLI_171]RKE20868.1 putative ABC transport system permease protein [Streptomyces sp. TLI_171]
MYRTALRNVLAHKGRLLMTALAVMLGTAFVAGTLVFSDTMGKAMRDSYSSSFSDVSVLVSTTADGSAGRAEGPKGHDRDAEQLTEADVKALAALPGAERARGVVSGFTGVADKSGNLVGEAWNARGANFVPGASGADTRYPMAEGRGPRTAGEIALNQQAAKKAGYHVGDKVRVAGNGAAEDTTLTGVFTTDDPQVSSGGTLVLMDTATAQQRLLEPGRFSSVVLTAKAGVPEAQLLDQARAQLPADAYELQTGQQLKDDQTKMVAESVSGMKTMLLVFAGISLFVGIFIIVNTFTMLIAQRIKELALLRAVGASRGQVTRSVLVEALAIGVIASVAGLLAGIGIGAGLQSLLHAFNEGLPTGALVIAPVTIVGTVAVGVVVTVLSALIPAVRASRIPPVAAMSSGDQPTTQRGLLIRNTIGVLLAGSGLGLILSGANGSGSDAQHKLELGAPLTLIGVFVLLPLLSRPVIALVGPVLAKVFGTPGKLARLNAVRNPRRTATTAAALTIGLTLVTALTVIGNSVTSAVTSMVGGSMKADYVVAMANGRELSPELTPLVARATGVTAVSQVDNVWWQLNGSEKSKAIEGYDADAFDKLATLTMRSGATAALKQNQILVNDEVAATYHLSVGSTVQAKVKEGVEATLTVGGVFERNDGFSPIVAPNKLIEQYDPEPLINQILVKGADGPSDALKQSIKDATGRNPVMEVQTKQDLVDRFSRIISTMLNLMYGLLGMAVIVAVLGVINTLAMSVFERKREIGMLRAIGLERRGIKRMIRLESVVISVFGALIGVLLGCFLAWAAARVLASELKGLTTVIPYGSVLVFLALAALVGVVAALWPARRASRLDILSSIKTD